MATNFQSSATLPATTFLNRDELAARWKTSISTLKRREKSGELVATRIGPRIVRYSMNQILAIEDAAVTGAV